MRRPRGDYADIVTPTVGELRRADLSRRQKRYFTMMACCLLFVLFGFFAPVPVPLRGIALALGAVLPPLAAIAGNGGPHG